MASSGEVSGSSPDSKPMMCADRITELGAFVMLHIARRRTDQLRHAVRIHELGHIEVDQALVVVKQEFRNTSVISSFPT